jgi:hypothetical protein
MPTKEVGRMLGTTRTRSALAFAAVGATLITAGCGQSTEQDRRPSSAAPPPAAQPPGHSEQLTIWLTGYSWQDNTPPGSSKVGEPVLHQVAGGTGTFADPITVATPGHAGDQEWEPGTRFYLPTVQRYVVVEDSGAAREPKGTDTHLDMWIGGEDGTKQATDACMNRFTGKVPAQVNPPDGLPVMGGEIFSGGQCHIPAQAENMGTYRNADSDDDDDDGGSDDGGHDSGHHHGDDDD